MYMPSIFNNSVFDNFDNWMDFSFPSFNQRLYGASSSQLMKTDVKETDKDYEVSIDLPGFKKEELQIELKDGYLTVSGVIAGSTDAVTVKAAKFTMSSLVPVVGGILSDAAETVLAGARILKNAVGVFGMLAVLCMCVAPFLQLGIHYLTYKVTSALSATVSSGRVAGLIDQIGGAFGLVLGMTGASALLLLISMVSAITAVVR